MPLHASIDIGSNTLKLLIANWEGDRLVARLQKVQYPRLGKQVKQKGRISEEAFQQAMGHLLDFRQTLRRLGARLEAVGATEAFRKAENGAVLKGKIEELLEQPCEILTGEEEARLTSLAVRHRYRHPGLYVIDVGGGSTEVIHGDSFRSHPIGAVVLHDRHGSHPEPGNRKDAGEYFADVLEPAEGEALVVGVGGTANSLAAMELEAGEGDSEKIEGTEITLGKLTRRIDRLADMGADLRTQVPGLSPERSDIIIPGLCVYEAALKALRVERITVSTYGLRYGLILAKLEEKQRLPQGALE